VPTNQEFLDIVLSRTQRRLPTVIRAGFQISRIRGIFFSDGFYFASKAAY
jgi:nucleolar GTP-binding protein